MLVCRQILNFGFKKQFKMPEVNIKDVPSVLFDNMKESKALICSLQAEIKSLMLTVSENQENIKIKTLTDENVKLQHEINLVKDELIQLQTANGILQVAVPGDECNKQNVKSIAQIPCTKTKVQTETVAPTKTEGVIKENKTVKAPKPKKTEAVSGSEPPIDVGRLDIRVGQVVNVKIHPDADQLYVEQINVGEETNRTVVSGLVKHIPLSELEQRYVLVLCNLKPAKMRGVLSEAMVLCASTPERVELLTPPAQSKAGDKVKVAGFTCNPDLPFMNPKKKIFEKVAEDLKVDSHSRASYKDVPWEVEGVTGFVTAQTITNCNIK